MTSLSSFTTNLDDACSSWSKDPSRHGGYLLLCWPRWIHVRINVSKKHVRTGSLNDTPQLDKDDSMCSKLKRDKTGAVVYALLILVIVAGASLGAATLAKVTEIQQAESTAPSTSSCYPPAPSFNKASGESQFSSFVGEAPNILIAYHSVSGGTEQLVNFTAGGALQCCNATVITVDVATLDPNDTVATAELLNSADGIILGSGVYNGDVQ